MEHLLGTAGESAGLSTIKKAISGCPVGMSFFYNSGDKPLDSSHSAG